MPGIEAPVIRVKERLVIEEGGEWMIISGSSTSSLEKTLALSGILELHISYGSAVRMAELGFPSMENREKK